jgi:DUF2946 family protein
MPSTGGIIRRACSAGRLAAWLALAAAGVQALIPLLIAAELSFLTAPAAAADVPCTMGHEHDDGSAAAAHHHQDGTRHDAPAKSHAHHCPLCTALHASNGVITPAGVAPKPPTVESRVTAASGVSSPGAARFPASYSPRAPPLIG